MNGGHLPIELIGVQGSSFLFRYTEPARYLNGIPLHKGFIYSRYSNGTEVRRGDALIASITAHNPYWDEPRGSELTDDETERISRLPVGSFCARGESTGRCPDEVSEREFAENICTERRR